MIYLIRVGVAITNSTLNKEKRDDMEVVTMKKEMDHFLQQAKYYQNSTHGVVLLKCEFWEMYAKFTRERDLFIACISHFQEYTLMGMETYKYMKQWYEKVDKALEWIDNIN